MNELKTLQDLVILSTDLFKPITYFFSLMNDKKISDELNRFPISNMDANPEWSAMIQAVKRTGANKLKKPLQITETFFFSVPTHQFIHGACFVSNMLFPLTVVYFSNVQTGLFAITGGKQSDAFRFSLAKISDLVNKR